MAHRWLRVIVMSVVVTATTVILATTAIIATVATAAPPTMVSVGGQTVEVSELEFRTIASSGASVPHSARLTRPTRLEFAHGNQILFSSRLVFHDNGSVWMAQAALGAEPVIWRRAADDSRVADLRLDCAQPPPVGGVERPVHFISFHDNGEYQSGCRLLTAGFFATAGGSRIQTAPKAAVDLTATGHLAYASEIGSGELHLDGQTVTLAPGSEVDFQINGSPHFFKLAEGERLSVIAEPLGRVTIGQTGGRRMYTEFDQAGRLENALLSEAVDVGTVLRAPAGSGLSFDVSDTPGKTGGTNREFTLILPELREVTVGGASFWTRQLRFGGDLHVAGLLSLRAFEFTTPEGDLMRVPAGAKVYFSSTGVITRVDVGSPRTPEPGGTSM